MSRSDFYECTLRDIANALDGYYECEERRIKEIEHQEQANWMRSRWVTCLILNTQVKKRIQPRDLAVFEWEKAAKPKWTKEQIDRMLDGMTFENLN